MRVYIYLCLCMFICNELCCFICKYIRVCIVWFLMLFVVYVCIYVFVSAKAPVTKVIFIITAVTSIVLSSVGGTSSRTRRTNAPTPSNLLALRVFPQIMERYEVKGVYWLFKAQQSSCLFCVYLSVCSLSFIPTHIFCVRIPYFIKLFFLLLCVFSLTLTAINVPSLVYSLSCFTSIVVAAINLPYSFHITWRVDIWSCTHLSFPSVWKTNGLREICCKCIHTPTNTHNIYTHTRIHT